ncbi:lysyl-tRNA synthetase, class II [Pseudoalteromonas ulvae UL12]|uniref:Elongation factor P lysine(34) lysyltransferase n=1 Tax=Pseudoalteromonas ulvae TaxID=107327 RepID=A0A244CPG3_PSEDV|nr:elongation factor P--(R)-beta-lysine ligase [Pseudoalteromonas ulvae]MBE0364934.1 lysyl-tRNA synthetase, class II [Pseudoalteromonas ulvae UL12]OUL57503.1 elongation factor P lysine(34) lysyltransferase [Pseudoalteromonas ulvae]
MQHWQPSSSNQHLRKRAAIIRQIREFFYQRNVLEVDTPLLSQASVTDVHLSSFSTEFVGPGFAKGLTLYLQTSPEFAMKRLLAADLGAIYQLGKAFRNEEAGRHHNPEFTMLEWYRPGFDHFDLMQEISELLTVVLGTTKVQRLTYQQAFEQVLSVDPLSATLEQLQQICQQQGFAEIAAHETDRDTLLQLLFSMCVETQIGQTEPCFVYHFPATQAALAQLCPENNQVAERFELYYKNMELANGFHELTDADEQLKRFNEDNIKRRAAGRHEVPIDRNLIAALESGIEPCAGVAIGVDRLIMLALECTHIKEVLSFDVTRA